MAKKTKQKADAKGQVRYPGFSKTESDGAFFAENLISHVTQKEGRYLRDETDGISILIGKRRIPVQADNRLFIGLMLTVNGVSTVSQAAKAAIQRLTYHAGENSSTLHLKSFSAVSSDWKRVYLPMPEGDLALVISADSITEVPNGDNQDHFWLEHPEGQSFKYNGDEAANGLALFESLLVETQACEAPAMRWFVGMHEGPLPLIRELAPIRQIVEHSGPTGSGKTTGAKRFCLLHGQDDVTGDFSVPALNNSNGLGLLVMDNKEQANLSQGYIDFCLLLSTGGKQARANKDGQNREAPKTRPVAVITSIEGMEKQELARRVLPVTYAVKGGHIDSTHIERSILEHRDVIQSGLVLVIQEFLRSANCPVENPNPVPDFQNHFGTLCGLLRAFEVVAEKGEGWAEDLVAEWDETITEVERPDSELETPLLKLLGAKSHFEVHAEMWNGKKGKLYVIQSSALLSLLQEQGLKLPQIPKNAIGLSKRLASTRFVEFTFVNAKIAPAMESLQRKNDQRSIGFFVPDDEVTERDKAA